MKRGEAVRDSEFGPKKIPDFGIRKGKVRKRGDGLRVAGCRKLGTGREGGAPSTRCRRVDDWDAVSELPANFFLPTGRVENFYFSIHFRFFLDSS